MLYRMLTGVLPYRAKSIIEVLDERLRPVPIVLMTDDTLLQLDAAFQKAGVSDVMIKPLGRSDVIDAVRMITILSS